MYCQVDFIIDLVSFCLLNITQHVRLWLPAEILFLHIRVNIIRLYFKGYISSGEIPLEIYECCLCICHWYDFGKVDYRTRWLAFCGHNN